MEKLKFIDLFAGIGGTRLGFERACELAGIIPDCVFTSEIKDYAVKVYKNYFGNHIVHGDITLIDTDSIPNFDVLLGGFPCQAFSSAGKRKGFLDTRGTLFFEIERILRKKRPRAFILENVEGLLTHDRIDKKSKIGRTMETILHNLKSMDYKVSYKVLNSKDFGLAQDRKRLFIVGSLEKEVPLCDFKNKSQKFKDVMEQGLPELKSELTSALLSHYAPEDLYGKAIKDKRGGKNNIHSWDLGLKGEVSKEQIKILNKLLTERRKKHWAEKKQIVWMDGMPLTENEIKTFYDSVELNQLLNDLVVKGYLKFEHPKEQIKKQEGNRSWVYRVPAKDKEKGYNIVTGKLSFELSKILDPEGITPTLVATDLSKLGVIDEGKIRKISKRECLRLFGFPEDFVINIPINKAYDLLGNTIAVPVVTSVAEKLISNLTIQ